MPLPRRPYLTTRAHGVLEQALRIAQERGESDVTPPDIALGLVRGDPRGVVAAVLESRGVALGAVEHDLAAQLPAPATTSPSTSEPAWTPGLERAVEAARAESRELGIEFYGAEQLLLALLRDRHGAPAQVLARHGVGFEDARTALARLHSGPAA